MGCQNCKEVMVSTPAPTTTLLAQDHTMAKRVSGDAVTELTDNVVTLAPYFKIKDLETFKSIWRKDYSNFAHKEDCVHYAFCFTDDNRAHCREAYPNAEKVLQHLADVDAPLKAVLDGPAELERLEVHGPKAEVDKLRDALSPLNCHFFVTEWGNRLPKPAMEHDTVCHLYPYFNLNQPVEFRKIWYDAFPDTKAHQEAEQSHQYGFSFDTTGDIASCRESYGNAEGVLLHLQNVDVPLKKVLNGPADLLRLEVHAPASEIEKLRPFLAPLGCQFFTTGWGFRNAVIDSSVKELDDSVVTLAPYFKLNDSEKFKNIWREDYKKFAHKTDCVHYAFCFTDDNRAHCREAYPNAEMVLQHLADVDAPLKAVLDGPAELERLEVHGPKAEVDKLRDALSPLGCLFYVVEWGNRPAKPVMENDTVCHLYPYFKLKQPEEFKKIWYDAFPDTKANQKAEQSHQYGFSFDTAGDIASCRESYANAEGVLLHLQNVDVPLKKVLNGPAELLRLELHAPASEVDKLRPALEPLGCQFFTTGWGFRNAVA